MKSKVFAIYDSKMKSYQQPQTFRTTEQGIRAFANSCKEQKSQLSMNPEDYSFHELGEFCDETGDLIKHMAPNSVARALDYTQEIPQA